MKFFTKTSFRSLVLKRELWEGTKKQNKTKQNKKRGGGGLDKNSRNPVYSHLYTNP